MKLGRETMGQLARKQRIKHLIKLITREKTLKLSQILAEMCLNFGITKVKLMEYLELIEQIGLIKIKNDVISLKTLEKKGENNEISSKNL